MSLALDDREADAETGQAVLPGRGRLGNEPTRHPLAMGKPCLPRWEIVKRVVDLVFASLNLAQHVRCLIESVGSLAFLALGPRLIGRVDAL